MNKHTNDWASAQTPLAFERRSKLLTLIDAILAPLKKRKHGDHGAVTPSSATIVMTPDQPKPWSAMIKAALERRLELYWNGDPHETLSVKDLHISKRLAWDLAAKRRPELLEVPASYEDCLVQANLSRGEAEQYLNCFPRDVAWLLCSGRMSAEFPSDQITQLGHELISSREIAWRWRVSPALRDALPAKHGIARCTGPFWPRADVEAFFAQRFPLGGPAE